MFNDESSMETITLFILYVANRVNISGYYNIVLCHEKSLINGNGK